MVMAYCGPRSIPYLEFLEWDDLSRDAALAWQAREASRCPDCGQLPGEFVDDKGEELDDFPAFPALTRCVPCWMVSSFREDNNLDPGDKVVFRPALVDGDESGDASPVDQGDDPTVTG